MSLQSRGVHCDGGGIMTTLFDRSRVGTMTRGISLDGSRFEPSKHHHGCSTSLQRHFEALMKIYESDKRYEGDAGKQSSRRCSISM